MSPRLSCGHPSYVFRWPRSSAVSVWRVDARFWILENGFKPCFCTSFVFRQKQSFSTQGWQVSIREDSYLCRSVIGILRTSKGHPQSKKCPKYAIFAPKTLIKVWARRDSNTQPSDLESDALPLRHRPHIYQKIPTTLGIPRRSPIQVLTRLDAAWLRWSDENRYIQRDMVVGNSKDLRSEFWFRNGHILGSIVVSISACHAEDRGSIPRRGGSILSL